MAKKPGSKSIKTLQKTEGKALSSAQTQSYQRLAVAALIKTGNLQKAQKILPQVNDATIWMWLGKAFADQELLEESSEAYGEALKLDRENKQAIIAQVGLLHKIAVNYAKQKEWGKASGFLRKAVELDPANADFRNLMEAVELMGFTSGVDFSQVSSSIQILENIQTRNNNRADVAHQLAVFYHRKAIADEEIIAQRNGHNWEMAFGNWAIVLNDTFYWQRWLLSRQKAYEHTLSDEELKKICQQSVPEIIKKLHGQYITFYGKSEQPDGVTRHKQLLARLSLEMNTARSLAEALAFLRKSNRTTKIAIACGPIMWDHFKIKPDIEEVIKSALDIDPKFEPARQLQDALQPTALIRAYFSEGLVDESIPLLEEQLTQMPNNKVAQELLQKAYLEKMKTLVSEASLSKARQIFDKARKFKLNTNDLEFEYAQQVLVKATKAYNDEKLEDADKLLRDALTVAPKNQMLKDKLADVTNRRVKLLVEGGMARDSSKAATYVEQGRKLLLEVDKIIGPKHPGLMQHLSSLQEISDTIEAGRHNAKGVEYLNTAASQFRSGLRSSGIASLRSARTELEQAARLQPGNKVIQENLQTARNLMSQLGLY